MKIQLSVNKNEFQRFLELVELSGDIQTKETLIVCKDSVISVLARTYNKIVIYKGMWKVDCKDNFEIGIDDITLLQKFVSNFPTDSINLKITDAKLELSSVTPKLRFTVPLRKAEYILTKIEESKFTSYLALAITNMVKIPQNVVKSIIGYSDLLGGKSLLLTGKDTDVILEIENNQNNIVAEFNINQEFKPFITKISNLFVDLLSTIGSDITLSVAKENSPVYLKTESEKITFEYLIAPLEVKKDDKAE